MATLPCPDGAGSLNNPANNPTPDKPFAPVSLCTGTWEITSTTPDVCQVGDQQRQEAYVAEALNINGAPINVFKLLGIHDQGNGSLLSSGTIFSSTPSPGYPASNINSGIGTWRSLETGQGVPGVSYVGFDFGPQLLVGTNDPKYDPNTPNWTSVKSVQITQSTIPDYWVKQVRVDISDGSCEVTSPTFAGQGNGTLITGELGINPVQCVITVTAVNSSTFNVLAKLSNLQVISLGIATVGQLFQSNIIEFTINPGAIAFSYGDSFVFLVNYIWKRVGIYNLIQTPLSQAINFQTSLLIKAVRIIPTLFSGANNWEVLAFDISNSAASNINDIQDLFYNENRDRDYAKTPILIKAQYTPVETVSDLSKFGFNILDQYIFTASFNSVVQLLGRPIVVGDILEVTPELQYDQNLMPVKKFLEVTDSGWSTEGFSTQWQPTLIKFQAQQTLPSQETRDIFGTLDSQKYQVPDSVLASQAGQLDTTPLTQTEEISKEAASRVPELGSDDQRVTIGSPMSDPVRHTPSLTPYPDGMQGAYIEDGLPPNNEPYTEGYALPDMSTMSDGQYFRLNYAESTGIPSRLYRYSALKNRWIYLETDKRGKYSSHNPLVRSILQSPTKQGLEKKLK